MRKVGLDNWIIRPIFERKCGKEEIRQCEKNWIELLQADLNTISPIQDDKRERDRMVKFYKRNLAEKKCYCNVCDKAFPCNWSLNQHKNSLKH